MKHDVARCCAEDDGSRQLGWQKRRRPRLAAALGAIALAWLAPVGLALAAPAVRDWPMFGGNVESTSANPDAAGITAERIRALRLRTVTLPGTVDASAIYLHDVEIRGARHDAIFVTTTYGKTLAIDAASGAILWQYTPPDYDRFAGTYQITTSTPAADPDRSAIYAAAPDGVIRKLALGDGHVIWQTAITRLPRREKMDSPIKV